MSSGWSEGRESDAVSEEKATREVMPKPEEGHVLVPKVERAARSFGVNA